MDSEAIADDCSGRWKSFEQCAYFFFELCGWCYQTSTAVLMLLMMKSAGRFTLRDIASIKIEREGSKSGARD